MRLDSTYLYAGIDIPLTLAILVGIVAIYAVYLTLRPIFADAQISSKDWNKIEDDSMALIHRRDRLIEELRDLEFEASMSKVDGKDLEELRNKYEREALALIEELDQKASQYKDLIQSQVQTALQQLQSKKKNQIQASQTQASQTQASQIQASQTQASPQTDQVSVQAIQEVKAPIQEVKAPIQEVKAPIQATSAIKASTPKNKSTQSNKRKK